MKSPGLQPLWDEARRLAREIGEVRFEHVRRELNKEADRLANEAMDEASRNARPLTPEFSTSCPRQDRAGVIGCVASGFSRTESELVRSVRL